ncbi:MAG: uracil-DNA glycosylase [Desulfobacteraceae bacterium]|nr:uracil-DNA glycosylase [Desulfobacteraceae bacterium]
MLKRWSQPYEKPLRPKTDINLENIKADLEGCKRCRLSRGRTQLVFGQGNSKARIVFVGEGPGYEEDQSGLPFAGPAGKLLDRIIAAMKLNRNQVYICNIVKCRLANNRQPQDEESETCLPFLKRQLAIIKPEVICTLGACATKVLLNTKNPLGRLRGRFHDYNGIQIMPTYHPAYLLQYPENKRATWEDIKKIMALLGLPL